MEHLPRIRISQITVILIHKFQSLQVLVMGLNLLTLERLSRTLMQIQIKLFRQAVASKIILHHHTVQLVQVILYKHKMAVKYKVLEEML